MYEHGGGGAAIRVDIFEKVDVDHPVDELKAQGKLVVVARVRRHEWMLVE